MSLYVDVILPMPFSRPFTYLLPPTAGRVEKGMRVVVPFGSRKCYTGLVSKVHTLPPEGEYKLKEIIEVLDEHPVVLPLQLQLWEWIADYYLCTLGDVFKAALPSGMKLESETVVLFNPKFTSIETLTLKEQAVVAQLSYTDGMDISRLEKATGCKNLLNTVKALMDKKVVLLNEEIKRSYKTLVETYVAICGNPNDSQLHILFDLLSRAPRQLDVLMKFLELSGYPEESSVREVTKRQLLVESKATSATLTGLLEKNILRLYQKKIGRLDNEMVTDTVPSHILNPHQQEAFNQLNIAFQQKDTCLLYGVTSSGKTEVYIHLIQKMLDEGRQVLYLLPEIALTTQITQRLKRVFGNRLGIYHSKFPDSQRVEIWQKQLSEHPYDIILGVRSSVLLPFRNLGLIIVDEEHETTYKQQDPAPRYHARSTALVLANMCGAKVLLGTATPALETWYNATKGKYGLVQLKERYQNICLPEIVPVDIKELRRKKRMKGLFSPLLLQEIAAALQRKEQVILFQNRRGFAPMIECTACGWVPKCIHCDVSLTYHKALSQLTCHYCGSSYSIPTVCPSCGEKTLVQRGFGTEKVEDEIAAYFPDVVTDRMDVDTTRSRSSYAQIIDRFEQGKTDILIGTQMVSKGLDFDNVSVVGILDADNMLNYPDFRSYERAYQLMAQVAGRAGRKNKQGKVILQTRSVDHPIIHQVISNNYEELASIQLGERELFHYPPFFHLVYIYLKHRDYKLTDKAADWMANILRSVFANRVYGPDKPLVGRAHGLYIKTIILKVESSASFSSARKLLLQVQNELASSTEFKAVSVYFDVDPL